MPEQAHRKGGQWLRAIVEWELFVAAWVVLILSDVFRQGEVLHDDPSLTV